MRYFVYVILLILYGKIYSQTTSSDSIYSCGFDISLPSRLLQSATTPNPELKKTIEKNYKSLFGSYLALDINSITVLEADNQNGNFKYAAADVKYDDDSGYIRYIYYDAKTLTPDFLKLGKGWVIRCILLHEIGHHMNSDSFNNKDRKQKELDADRFAAVHLARLKMQGAPNLDYNSASMVITGLEASPPNSGYPTKAERLEVFQKGWNDGLLPPDYSTMYAIAFSSKNNKNKTLSNKELNGLFNKSVYAIYTDQGGSEVAKAKVEIPSIKPDFFIKDNTLVYKKNSSTEIEIGKLAHTEKPGYKMMIYDKYYYYWYITDDNKIYYIDNNDNIYIGSID